MEEDSLKDAALVLVVQGCFIVSQQGEDGKEKELHHCYPGGLLGQLQVSWGSSIYSNTTLRALQDCKTCSSRLVHFARFAWVTLSPFYPPNRFGDVFKNNLIKLPRLQI